MAAGPRSVPLAFKKPCLIQQEAVRIWTELAVLEFRDDRLCQLYSVICVISAISVLKVSVLLFCFLGRLRVGAHRGILLCKSTKHS